MKKFLLLTLTVLLLLSIGLPAALAADSDFQFAKKSVALFEGESTDLELLTQGDCANAAVTFKSSNMKVATVTGDGHLTALSKGSVRITATCTVGRKKHTATINVTVNRAATSISVSNEEDWNLYAADDALLTDLVDNEDDLPVIMLVPGSKIKVKTTVLPKDVSNSNATLSSDDTDVLTVSGATATAVAPGNAILTVASESTPDVFVQYLVLVSQPVTSVTVTGDSTMFVGDEIQLYANALPSAATIQDVTWSSSKTSVATVDEYGVVTAIKSGDTTITATAIDGSEVSGSHKLLVSVRPTAVKLSSSSEILKVGSKATLRATVSPTTVGDKGVVWESSDPSVATVSKGVVTGVSVGTATITCSSEIAPDVYTECEVTVVQPVTSVSSLTGKLEVNVGETIDTSWSVQPASATIQTLSFKSSDKRIATVDADGVVYGVSGGTVTISATSTDGTNRVGRVTVTVIQPVEGVHMKQDNWSVGVDEKITIAAILEPTNATNKTMTWSVGDSYIAKIKGNNNRPTVTGVAWGDTVIYGMTEDGGYTTSANLHVGNYNKALIMTDLYLSANAIKMSVRNESNMTITRFNFQVEVYDIYDRPIVCNSKGTNILYGYYAHDLQMGSSTQHGRFTFQDFYQPEEEIGHIIMHITGYSTTTGFTHSIKTAYQESIEYYSPNWVPSNPEPEEPEDPEYPEEPEYPEL